MGLTRLWLKRAVGKAARRTVVGRLIDKEDHRKGRIDSDYVNRILEDTWMRFDRMIAEANLEAYETRGNRFNVTLAIGTNALFRSLLTEGFTREYATELVSDLGWIVYLSMSKIPRLIARFVTRNPQRRMNLVLRMFLRFPFSRPSGNGPGYRCTFGPEVDHFRTDWTQCAPLEYVKAYGSEAEVKFFHDTWCKYDWALAQTIVEGGYYERVHTLSAGDTVCDMRWYGQMPEHRQKASQKPGDEIGNVSKSREV